MAATTLASTAFQARAQYQEGKYAQGVAEYNARVQENEATQLRNIAVEEENLQRQKTAELLSTQRAQIGASGVELGTGSAAQLQEATTTLGEADALRIRSNYESQIQAKETQAGLTRAQGEFAAQAGEMSAFGTILSGTAKTLGTGVADKWFTPDSAASLT